MKKNLFLIPMDFAMMTACVKEDETTIPSEPGSPVMDYGMKVCDTLLHYNNISACYRDANSRMVSEPIATTEWSKHFDGFGDSLVLRETYVFRDEVDTSCTNSEWLIVNGDVAKINARCDCFAASARERKDGSMAFLVGDVGCEYNHNLIF